MPALAHLDNLREGELVGRDLVEAQALGSGLPSFTLDPPPPAPEPGEPVGGKLWIDEHAGRRREPEDLGEVGDRARALRAAQHPEMALRPFR